uniref:Uncharacterized protein n=1 Tax=Cyprinus carpio carpio TaxID=630221 RepID=A0A9J8BE77_CYPCA
MNHYNRINFSRRNPNSNPMRVLRSNHPNNCSRTSILGTFLLSQHSL